MHSHARTSAKIDATLVYLAVFLVLFFLRKSRGEVLKKINCGFETRSFPNSHLQKATKTTKIIDFGLIHPFVFFACRAGALAQVGCLLLGPASQNLGYN